MCGYYGCAPLCLVWGDVIAGHTRPAENSPHSVKVLFQREASLSFSVSAQGFQTVGYCRFVLTQRLESLLN
ncbi:hypothetical protein COCON_G00121480 [Conger conger]|uniref:Uncharacterized protein n=1 Tax=Conger conger TaxID=82655 RepID=A0A9Q1DH95_CONCO|nr:hypothetical protein COCON_G00121480 [Conger conger]